MFGFIENVFIYVLLRTAPKLSVSGKYLGRSRTRMEEACNLSASIPVRSQSLVPTLLRKLLGEMSRSHVVLVMRVAFSDFLTAPLIRPGNKLLSNGCVYVKRVIHQ